MLSKFKDLKIRSKMITTIEIKEKILHRKILCSLLGHKFIVTRNITNHFKEFKCTVCQLELTNDEKGRKTFLTPELKEINETLIGFYNKRIHSV